MYKGQNFFKIKRRKRFTLSKMLLPLKNLKDFLLCNELNNKNKGLIEQPNVIVMFESRVVKK